MLIRFREDLTGKAIKLMDYDAVGEKREAPILVQSATLSVLDDRLGRTSFRQAVP